MISYFAILPQINNIQAATLYWVGADGANASVATNWSTTNPTSCTTGITPSALAPATVDTITMDADCDDSVSWDSGATAQITALGLNSGYAGTITLARSLIVSTTMSEAGGTFTAGANTFEVDTNFTLSAGTFNASSGTTTFKAAFNISGSAVFNANSGTVDFAGGTGALACNNITFNVVNFAGQTGTKTVGSACSLPLGASPTIPTNITLNGILSGTGTLTETAGTLIMNSGASLSGFSGLNVAAFTITGATVDLSGYSSYTASALTTVTSGSLTLSSTANTLAALTVNGGTVTESAGTFSASSNTILSSGSLTFVNGADLNGNLTISGGTFTAPSGTLTLSGALTISNSPTFNANSGTFTFDGSTTSILSCNNVTFNLVTFNQGISTANKTVNSDCSLPLGNNPSSPGRVTLTGGTLSGTGTFNVTGTFTLNAGAVLSGFTGLVTNAVTISGATLNLGSYTTVDINGGFSFTSGTFTAPSGTMSLAGSLTISGTPVFNANGGTLVLDGGSATLACNNVTFNLVTIVVAGKTVGSDCSLPLGNNPSILGVTLNGTLSGTGLLTSTGTFTLNSGAVLSGFTALNVSQFTIAGAILDLSSYSSFTAGSTVTLSSGTLTLPTSADLNGSLIISGGTFIAPTGTITLNGQFSHTAGIFNNSSGTFILDGINQSITGSNTFYNLSKAVIATDILTFPAGATQTITHTLTLQGTSGIFLSLRSSASPSQWSIDPQGTRNIDYVDVQDSNNINTTTILATNSIDSGNNTNWTIQSPPPTPTPTSTQQSSGGSSTSSEAPKAPVCSVQAPGANPPWLFATITKGSGEIELQFKDGQDPITDYSIEYGVKSGEYIYGGDRVVQKGTKSYIVKSLKPSTTYYFKIRGSNGCAPGPWSNEMHATTNSLFASSLEIVSSTLKPVTDTQTDITNNDSKPPETIDKTNDTTVQPAEDGSYKVNVTIKDTNRKAVLGAEVTLHSKVQTAKTDKLGAVHFQNVESGDHTVYIAYGNYKGEQTLNLSGDVKEYNLNVTVKPQNILLTTQGMIFIGFLILIIIILTVLLLRKNHKSRE